MNIIDNFNENIICVLENIKKIFMQKGIKAYIVGGAVRDYLLNIKCNDIDICIECNPIDIIKYIPEIKSYKYYDKFQTATVIFENEVQVDLIRCRREIYIHNGALPNIIPSDIYDDLRRRDFTINAIAYDLNKNRIIDLFNGIEDLKNKELRKIKNNSYDEDPTRIFRAIKYSIRYNLNLYDYNEIVNSIDNNVFKNISNDRIVKEILLIIKEEKWANMLRKCGSLGIFSIDYDIFGMNNKFVSYDNLEVRLINMFLSLKDDKYKDILVENSVLSKNLKKSLKKNYNNQLFHELKKAKDNFDIYKILNKCNKYDIILLSFYGIFLFKIINYFKLKVISKNIKSNYINEIKVKDKALIGYIVNYVNSIQLNCKINLDRNFIVSNIGAIIDEIKYKNSKF